MLEISTAKILCFSDMSKYLVENFALFYSITLVILLNTIPPVPTSRNLFFNLCHTDLNHLNRLLYLRKNKNNPHVSMRCLSPL